MTLLSYLNPFVSCYNKPVRLMQYMSNPADWPQAHLAGSVEYQQQMRLRSQQAEPRYMCD